MDNKYYEHYIKQLINTIPTQVTIKRVESADDGYGGRVESFINSEATVAFYDRKAKIEFFNDAGVGYTGASVTKILALGNADIKPGDHLSTVDNEYKVLFVREYFNICLQIEIEVIK